MGHDIRGEIRVDPHNDLPDYSGPFRQDLRFSDFSKEALVNMLGMANQYYGVTTRSWAAQVIERYGKEVMIDVQWRLGSSLSSQLQRMIDEWMVLPDDEADAVVTEVERTSQLGAMMAAPSPSTRSSPIRIPGTPQRPAGELGIGKPRVLADGH